ncbi:hypothetical protein HY522_01995 [bacterium]|nr:hypothetical protein [bacterium]
MGGVIPNDVVPNQVVIPRASNAALQFDFLRQQLAKTVPVGPPGRAGVDMNITMAAQRDNARLPMDVGSRIDLLG